MNHKQPPQVKGLTLRVLGYIKQHQQQYSYPPTVREIGRACGITSTSVVNYHITKLIDAGKLARQSGTSRTLRVIDNTLADSAAANAAPFLGATDELKSLKKALSPFIGLWRSLLKDRDDASIFTMHKVEGRVVSVTCGQVRAVLALIEG